jgi:hypothetical protein
MVKPAPVMEAELTVTAVVPDEVIVTEVVATEFTATLPKFRAVAVTFNSGFAPAPVPLKDTTAMLPLVAVLLSMESFPVADPASVGFN